MQAIKFKIVTPERLVYEAEIDSVSLPTEQGEITVLPGHIPLVSTLMPGELIVRKGADAQPMAVSGGFIEVRKGGEVTVLADTAERFHEIDLARAEEAKKRAEKLLTERHEEDVDYTALAARMEKELTRLRIAKKYAHMRHQRTPVGSSDNN